MGKFLSLNLIQQYRLQLGQIIYHLKHYLISIKVLFEDFPQALFFFVAKYSRSHCEIQISISDVPKYLSVCFDLFTSLALWEKPEFFLAVLANRVPTYQHMSDVFISSIWSQHNIQTLSLGIHHLEVKKKVFGDKNAKFPVFTRRLSFSFPETHFLPFLFPIIDTRGIFLNAATRWASLLTWDYFIS